MDMAKCGLEVRNAGPQASATPHTPIHEQPENDIAENGSRHTPSLLGRGEHCRQHMGVPGPCRVPGPGSRGRRCRDRSEVGRAGCLANKAPAIPGQKSASIMLDQWNFGTMPLSLPVKARVVGG